MKYTPKTGYEFARELSVSILGHSELLQASKHFPIVFWDTNDKKMPTLPQALLSLEKNKNAFVGADGSWQAGYVTKHIRRYPFILGRLPKENRFAVMIDEDAPQFQEDTGARMFDESGEPTELLKKATSFLEEYKKELDLTLRLVQEIEEQDLLKPMTFNIKKGKAQKQIKGFRTIDYKKLVTLDDKILAQWVRNGVMRMIYAHMGSLSNIQKLAQLQGIEPPEAENK